MAHMTKDVLINYLETGLRLDVAGLEDSAPLISAGLIDSLDVASLATFIESTCNFKFEADDLALENLDSIERILKFTNAKARTPLPE